MRTLKELGTLVAEDSAWRYFQKRADLNAMALGMGLQAPGIVHDVKKRYEDTKRQLALGATTQLGEKVAVSTSTYAANYAPAASKGIMNSLKNIDGGKILSSVATKTISGLAADGIKGGLSGAWNAFSHRNDGEARAAIIAELKKTDPIISQANDKVLNEAFASMVRFAPTLSTDKNAVRSYLREAIMSGTGPNYSTIKALADAEHTVTGRGQGR